MAGKGLGLERTQGNGSGVSHAADHHLARGVVSELDPSMEQPGALSSPAKAAHKALSADIELLLSSATVGNFDFRADLTKHHGADREIAQALNQTLDLVVDKLNLYKTIVDSVPFPIQVIDKDMNSVFLNKAFEKLMVDADFIRSRQDAPGKPCSTASAAICKTQNCGIVQLNKGVGESYFDWHGQSCKQDTSRLVNAKGEHVGYIEVVQDLTAIVRNKDYTACEVDRLAGNLTKLAQG